MKCKDILTLCMILRIEGESNSFDVIPFYIFCQRDLCRSFVFVYINKSVTVRLSTVKGN